jgi:chemotaxis protein MotB
VREADERRNWTMMKFGAGLSVVLAGMLCGPVAAIAADQSPSMAMPESGLSVEADITLKNFSAGFIRTAMPYEARVSQITGDNQTTGNRRLLGGGDQIYLELTRPQDIAPGDKFILYRQVKKVYHPVRGEYLGDLTAILGVAKVLRVTGNKATVKIERSFGAVFPGDGAMRQSASPQPPPAFFGQSLPDGTGVIVELPPGQTLIGQGHMVYIDWGRNDGLKIGDRLDVIRENPDIPIQVIGELQVVAVEDLTATARVTKSKAPFLLGDRFTAKSRLRDEASAPQERKEALFQEMAATPRTAEAVQEAHAAPQARDLERELADLARQLEFDPGSAPATAASLPILMKMKALLREAPDSRVVVEGHTDGQKIGPSLKELYKSNQELSRARAAAVAGSLSEEGGISSRNITIVGYADAKPVASNGTEAGRKRNRRIEITLLPDEPPPAPPPTPTTAMPEAAEPSPPAPEPAAPVTTPPTP